jgi:uncharacterized protein YqcC (DUF446 family)
MLVDEIEQALRALGWVHGEVGLPLQVSTAFGAGEMPFERWLAQVYLPRLHEARRDGRWPTSSHVAVAAWRNLDGLPEAEPLLRLLARLDDDINKGAR